MILLSLRASILKVLFISDARFFYLCEVELDIRDIWDVSDFLFFWWFDTSLFDKNDISLLFYLNGDLIVFYSFSTSRDSPSDD